MHTPKYAQYLETVLKSFGPLLILVQYNYNLLALLMLHQQNVGLNRKIKEKGKIIFLIFLLETLKVLDGYVLIPLNHNSAASL